MALSIRHAARDEERRAETDADDAHHEGGRGHGARYEAGAVEPAEALASVEGEEDCAHHQLAGEAVIEPDCKGQGGAEAANARPAPRGDRR